MDIHFLKKVRDKSENCYIIVEGKNDKKILEYIGFKNVYTLYEIREILRKKKYDKAIILTDNDRKGKKIYKRIKDLLLSEDIVDDYIIRKKFFRKIRKSHIEDLKNEIEDIKFYINLLYGIYYN